MTSAMGGLAAMAKADRQIREREFLQRLAVQKYEEIVSTNQFETAELSGSFDSANAANYEWSASVEPSGEESLEILTVTVNRTGDTEGPHSVLDGLIFNPPVEGGAQ